MKFSHFLRLFLGEPHAGGMVPFIALIALYIKKVRVKRLQTNAILFPVSESGLQLFLNRVIRSSVKECDRVYGV